MLNISDLQSGKCVRMADASLSAEAIQTEVEGRGFCTVRGTLVNQAKPRTVTKALKGKGGEEELPDLNNGQSGMVVVGPGHIVWED